MDMQLITDVCLVQVKCSFPLEIQTLSLIFLQQGMYPTYRPRPPFGDHGGPGFPPQRPRGPMAQGPPPPPPAPPLSLLGKPTPSPPPPLPPPSSKTSSANPPHQSQAQVSGESDGGGGGGGRGGDGRGFSEATKFRQESQQLHTGSRWNKSYQPREYQMILAKIIKL